MKKRLALRSLLSVDAALHEGRRFLLRRLLRGLDVLIEAEQVGWIIFPLDAFQPRVIFAERALDELLAFLAESGKIEIDAALVQKNDAIIARCQRWISENYAISNPVAAMTERSELTSPTFARRFRAATGYMPMD